MDADCLIKLAKAGLKELVCRHDAVFIAAIVKEEVVDAGKAKDCADAFAVEKNIAADLVSVIKHAPEYASGDHALADLFLKKSYDAVATDDAKLTRRLRTLGIPYILPGLIIYRFLKEGRINQNSARKALNQLAEFISPDEFSAVRLLMEGIK